MDKFDIISEVDKLLILQRNEIVFIKLEDNRVLELKLKNYNTTNIYHLKDRINKMLDIKIQQQELFYKEIELHNNDILSERNIGPWSTLNLYIANLKLMLRFRETDLYHIYLQSKSKLSKLKERIANYLNIPVEFQILYCDNQLLDNDEQTLMDYNIRYDSIIKIKDNNMKIYIKTTFSFPTRLTLQLYPTATVKEIKEVIDNVLHFNPVDQKFIFNNRTLYDCDRLREKGIGEGSNLHLFVTPHVLHLNIQLETDHKVTVVCLTTDTVGQLKQKLEMLTNIPIAKQALYLDSTKLSNHTSFLVAYNFNETSNLILKNEETFPIIVKIEQESTGNLITCEILIQLSDTMADLKCKIESQEHIPYCAQLFIAYYGPKSDSMEYFVNNPKDELLLVIVNPINYCKVPNSLIKHNFYLLMIGKSRHINCTTLDWDYSMSGF